MTYMGEVSSVEIQTDEDGFSIILSDEFGTASRFNVQNCAEQLYDTVTGMIGPWLAEKEAAKRTRPIGDTEEPFYVGVPDLRDHAFRTAEIIAGLYDQEKDR